MNFKILKVGCHVGPNSEGLGRRVDADKRDSVPEAFRQLFRYHPLERLNFQNPPSPPVQLLGRCGLKPLLRPVRQCTKTAGQYLAPAERIFLLNPLLDTFLKPL